MPWTVFRNGLLALLLLAPFAAAGDASSAAVNTLLAQAHHSYNQGQHEQAAALLERALRIDARNPILWHNLAGVRLQQQDWARALSLAAKSNSLSVGDRMLRIRNWVVIVLACEGMQDKTCTD